MYYNYNLIPFKMLKYEHVIFKKNHKQKASNIKKKPKDCLEHIDTLINMSIFKRGNLYIHVTDIRYCRTMIVITLFSVVCYIL